MLTTTDEVRVAITDGIGVGLARPGVRWFLTADQIAVAKAVSLIAARDDNFVSEVLSVLPSCYSVRGDVMANAAVLARHANLGASLTSFGIDFVALATELEAAFVADAKKTAADLLVIVESALSGAASPPKQAGVGPLVGLLAQLWAALKANPALATDLFTFILSLLAGTPLAPVTP